MNFSSTLEATGWALLHFTWIGAAWGLFALGALMMLRGRTPGVRYSVCLVSFLSLPGLFGWLLWREYSNASLAAANRSASTLHPLNGFSGEASANLPSPLASTLSWAEPMVPYLPWFWLAGSLLVALRLPIGLWGLRGLRRSALPSPLPSSIVNAFERAASKVRTKVPITLALSKQVSGAITIGILRPMVLLPASLVAGMSPRELEMILIHELAHVRRFDNVVSLVQGAMESVFFFHPLVWSLSRRLRHERELCCDDAVVRALGSPDIYARTLLRACDLSSGRNPSLAASLNGPRMVDRVRHLLNKENSRMCRTQRVFGSLLAAVCLTVLLAGAAAQQCNDQCCPSKKTAKKPVRYARLVDDQHHGGATIFATSTATSCTNCHTGKKTKEQWAKMKSPHHPHGKKLLSTQDCASCHKTAGKPKQYYLDNPNNSRRYELKPGHRIALITDTPHKQSPSKGSNEVRYLTLKPGQNIVQLTDIPQAKSSGFDPVHARSFESLTGEQVQIWATSPYSKDTESNAKSGGFWSLKPGQHIIELTETPHAKKSARDPVLAQRYVLVDDDSAKKSSKKIKEYERVAVLDGTTQKTQEYARKLSKASHEVVLGMKASDEKGTDLEEELRRTRLEVQRLRADVQRLLKRYDINHHEQK